MSDGDPAPSYVVDYELSADDLREWAGADRSLARRRTSAAIWMTLSLLGAAAGTVTSLVINYRLVACVTAEPTPKYAVPHIWLWQQCDPGSPGSLLWDEAVLIGAIAVLWCLGVSYAVNFWRATPAYQARRWLAEPGAAGRYRDEVATAGITAFGPDGVISYLPWSAVHGIRETEQRFFVLGPNARIRSVLPKRGLSDPASVPRLGDFLRGSARGSHQS